MDAAPSLEHLAAEAAKGLPRAHVHEEMKPGQAQHLVNFVILVPPSFKEGTGTLRREAAPAIRADVGGGKWPAWSRLSPRSFRYEVLGACLSLRRQAVPVT